MEGNKGTVCVTGGTGYIASWLIMRLLQHGYSVNATIRAKPERKRDISFLKSLPGALEKLHLFEADLGDPDSFNAAIERCIGVFHLAASVELEDGEPEEVVTRRAVNGALGILKACLKSSTVKRVVYTSSQAAVAFNGKEEDIMDETYWTDVDLLKANMQTGSSYAISKTSTEKAAIEFAEENGLDLVTVIPSLVAGPFICPQFPASVRMMLALVSGDESLYHVIFNASLVHVDDVVGAHIFLFENPDAKGRYNCSSQMSTIVEIAEFLSAKYPEFPIPTIESLKKFKSFKTPGLSSKKLLDSGFTFKYGLDEMFEGAIQCCKEKGYL
ncbi:vestitone reductase-like [Tripterygium wilfordii]|uniref:vestitone reductase-like n=1 Tax=Tripterygium wilfordii TaxID=458696 RepID=UPI0018F833CE|nr:vestitone reductase-like [Tripterygium wilfordii]